MQNECHCNQVGCESCKNRHRKDTIELIAGLSIALLAGVALPTLFYVVFLGVCLIVIINGGPYTDYGIDPRYRTSVWIALLGIIVSLPVRVLLFLYFTYLSN
jgi:hypothetical protein